MPSMLMKKISSSRVLKNLGVQNIKLEQPRRLLINPWTMEDTLLIRIFFKRGEKKFPLRAFVITYFRKRSHVNMFAKLNSTLQNKNKKIARNAINHSR